MGAQGGHQREVTVLDLRGSSAPPSAEVMNQYTLFVRLCRRKFRVLALYLGCPDDVPHTVPVMRVYSFGSRDDSALQSADWALEQVPYQEIEPLARSLAKEHMCRYAFLLDHPLPTADFLRLVLPHLVERELDANQRTLFNLA